MPEFDTLAAPETTVPQTKPKPFREQSLEERYQHLLTRLKEKVDGWTMWIDDLRTAAQVEEGLGNPGKACGLRAKANAIRDCQRAIQPYLERHLKAMKP